MIGRLLLLCLAGLSPTLATDYWIAPGESFDAIQAQLQPGDTVHFPESATPWPSGIRITASGTREAPIVIDGHGAVISGRGTLPASAWKDEGGGVFSRPLPNNAWGMPRVWEGGFPLVWFDGKAAPLAPSSDDLEPGHYFLYKNQPELKSDPRHNTLYIFPPGGDLSTVESIVGEGGIYVGGDYVTVRNFVTEYGGRDGFATHRNKGVVFEHIEVRYFMDQGMSHHGAEVTVRHAYFHDNAGCGIVDVYPEACVRYEDCRIENDTWRGGVEFHSGRFEMVDCTIRGNAKTALTVTKEAQVRLERVTIESADTGIRLAADSQLAMETCDVKGATAISVRIRGEVDEAQLRVDDCNFDGEIVISRVVLDPAGVWKKTTEGLESLWRALGK